MSEFIYTTTGKHRPAPIIWETITFKLTGAKGRVYWTGRPSVRIEDTRDNPIQWMPLTNEGTITGATFIQVHVDEVTDEYAALTVLPSEDKTAGLMHALNSTVVFVAARQLEAAGLI